MARKRILKKAFTIAVTGSGQSVEQTFTLDTNIELITGIKLSSNKPDLLRNRGSQQIILNGEELFESGYSSQDFYSSVNVNPNDRFFDLKDFSANKEGLAAGNRTLKVVFQDTNNPDYAFAAYNVFITLDAQSEDKY